jgi:hypothetical protein
MPFFKYWAMSKMHAKDKHASLFWPDVSDNEKGLMILSGGHLINILRVYLTAVASKDGKI